MKGLHQVGEIGHQDLARFLTSQGFGRQTCSPPAENVEVEELPVVPTKATCAVPS